MEVKKWTDYDMDWNDPDPGKPEYFLALYNAVFERYKILGEGWSSELATVNLPNIQNNIWNINALSNLIKMINILFQYYVDIDFKDYYRTTKRPNKR